MSTTLVERNAVAKPRDLAWEFSNADRKKTPFSSSLSKGPKPTNMLMEYPAEQFAAPALGGVMDEADAGTPVNPRDNDRVISARAQIWEKVGALGGLAQTVLQTAGVVPKQQLTKAIAKKMVELKRNVELTYLSDQDSRPEAGTDSYLTRGMGSWISSTAQSDLPVDALYRTPAGSISTTALASYTDDTIVDVFQSMHTQHGDTAAEFDIWAGSLWKKTVGRLTVYNTSEAGKDSVRQYTQEQKDTTLRLGKVDVLETPFGTGVIRLCNFINTGGDHTTAASKSLAYAVLPEMVEERVVEESNPQMLGKTGRGQKFLVTRTAALACLNPLPLGKFAPAA